LSTGAEYTPAGVEVGLGARYKKGTALMHVVEPGKVHIAPIHDVERARFRARFNRQQIKHAHVGQLAVADVQEAGNAATQIQQRVQLDGGFGGAKRCPIKQAQAQVHGARIHRVDTACNVHTSPSGSSA
jgi:hypothetical protein